MREEDIDAEFLSMVENSLADVSADADAEAQAQAEVEIVNIIKAVSKLNELSTFLGRFTLSSMVLGPDQMAPLGEEIMFGVAEVERAAALVLQDLMEYADSCDCPDCTCYCEELPEEMLCDSCVRVEECECGLDGTCAVCIEYELKHPSD